MDSILYPFVVAVAWLWIRIHDLLLLVGMSSGAGLAWIISIILLTVLVRVLIIPLYLKQLKSMRGTSIVQPQMQKIQAKYKGKTDNVSVAIRHRFIGAFHALTLHQINVTGSSSSDPRQPRRIQMTVLTDRT